MKFITRTFAVFLLVAALVFGGLVSCGPPSKNTIQKLDNAALIIVREIEANETLPDQLLAEKVITQDQYVQVVKVIGEIKSGAGTVEHGLSVALTVEKPSLSSLIPLVVDVIAKVRTLGSFPANAKLQGFLAAVEIGLRVLGSYFALQVSQARQMGLSDRQICKNAGVDYDKERFDLVASAYDGARFDEWAAAL